MGSYFRDYMDRKASQRPTIGDTKFSAVTSDHMGWLKCDGRSLSVANFNLLFQVIGYSFGGSGNNFNLPDAQGRVPGAIGPNGESTRKLGDVSGSETHTLTIAQMPAHKHGSVDVTGGTNGNGNTTTNTTGVTDTGHSHSIPFSAAALTGVGPSDDVTQGGSAFNTGTASANISDPGHFHSIGSTGGGAAHNNMQPTIFMGSLYMYCGKTSVGNWPYTTGTNIL